MAKRRKKAKRKVIYKREKKISASKKAKIIAILTLLLTFLIVLSFFKATGIAGKYFNVANTFLFGKGAYALPIFLLIFAVSLFYSKFRRKLLYPTIGLIVLVIATSGILELIDFKKYPANFEHFNFAHSGIGGWLGNIVSWPIMKVFGFLGAIAVFLAFFAIGTIIFWPVLNEERSRREKKREEKFQAKPVKPVIKKIFMPKFKVEKVGQEEIIKEAKAPKAPIAIEQKEPSFELIKEESYSFPPLDLLSPDKGKPLAGNIKTNSVIIKRTLENFGIAVEMFSVNIGPTVTQYTLKPAAGVKLSRITALNNNLSLALAAHPIRIEAPIPGKSLVGIEVPNQSRTLVRLRNLLSQPEFQKASSPLVFTLGRDVIGHPVYSDLARMPHLLVAGSTGTGKTIFLNSLILSLLYRNSPKRLRFVLIDPKRVEFSYYNQLPHLLTPIIWEPQKAIAAIQWLIEQMEERFEFLSKKGARDIDSYNKKINHSGNPNELMPYIVLIIDELADLMVARGREVETGIVRLAQKARAVGIHLVLATQRPSVEVITGLIKANIIARIAFQVASQVDSRTILDMAGAEKLLGLGDMLFVSPQITKPKRIQGVYVSEREVNNVVNFISDHYKEEARDKLSEAISEEIEKEARQGETFGTAGDDPLYEKAKSLVIETQKASASFLQRRLRIGYARAARLLDMLEERGVVGPSKGAKPRDVYLTEEQSKEASQYEQDRQNNNFDT